MMILSLPLLLTLIITTKTTIWNKLFEKLTVAQLLFTKHATRPYPEPRESNSYSHIFISYIFNIHFNIILVVAQGPVPSGSDGHVG
jgi:hypothetical protein